MKRRAFIMLLGGVAAWPCIVRGQQPAKLPTVGLLVPGTPSAHGQLFATLVQRLRELGWIEGRTVAIQHRFAEGRAARFSEIAAEFVWMKVDVIVTTGAAILEARQATSVIPIVFAVASDPVGSGYVTSLAHPGGNITGLSLQTTDLASKRIELLREVAPGIGRLAIMGNSGFAAVMLEMRELETTARTLGLDVITLDVRRAEDIAAAFDAIKGRAQALHVCADSTTASNRIRIIALAQVAGLPTMFTSRREVEAGGLLSYGPNFSDLYRRAGDYVDKILRGTKPADIPVEQPTKFDLVINLTTAKALGLTIPESFLLRADEVLE